MKIIVKPKQKEEAELYSDFSGDRFEHDIPEVELKLSFNYGSKFDQSSLEFHLSDSDAVELLETIKYKLSKKTKEDLNAKLEKLENNYNESVDVRSWESCDYYGNNIDLYRYLLGIHEE
jgi:hypothetical protein